MKHIKTYEWVTSKSHDVDLKYDNDFQPEEPKKVSQLIENTKDYIELNFNKIYKIVINENDVSVEFDTPQRLKKYRDLDVKMINISEITRGVRQKYQIKLVIMEDYKDISGNEKVTERSKMVDIQEHEYEYMRDFLTELQDKHIEITSREQRGQIEDILEPSKIISKKYNL